MLEINKRFTTVGIAAFVDHSFHRVSARGFHDHARAIAGSAFQDELPFWERTYGPVLRFNLQGMRTAARIEIAFPNKSRLRTVPVTCEADNSHGQQLDLTAGSRIKHRQWSSNVSVIVTLQTAKRKSRRP